MCGYRKNLTHLQSILLFKDSLTPRIQTLLKPTVCLLLMTRCTNALEKSIGKEDWCCEARCRIGLSLRRQRIDIERNPLSSLSNRGDFGRRESPTRPK